MSLRHGLVSHSAAWPAGPCAASAGWRRSLWASLAVVAGGAWLLLRRPAVNGPRPGSCRSRGLAGKEDWPAFAPDGEQVAFAWSGEKFDNTDIYVTLVGSTDVRRLTTDPAEDYAPSWSPDGRRIAFLRRVGQCRSHSCHLGVGWARAEGERLPGGGIAASALIALQITWSPDGRYIVAGRDPAIGRSDSAGIYLIPWRAASLARLRDRRVPRSTFPQCFPRTAAALRTRRATRPGWTFRWLLPGKCAVRVVDVDADFCSDGCATNIDAQPVDPAGMAWSRDGKSIVFVGAGPSSVNLWRLWVDGTRPPETVEIAGRCTPEHPATVASRDRLVFSRFDWDTHLYRFNAGTPAERVAASSSFEGDPHFSPDGRRIVFTSGRSGKIAIWVAAADGTARVSSPAPDGDGKDHPTGRRMAARSRLMLTKSTAMSTSGPSLRGRHARRITKDAGDQTAPTWSRDGRWIYFSDHREGGREIWRIPASGGAPEQVTRTGSGFLAYESADGASLLYQPNNGDSALLVVPLTGGGAPRQLVGCVRNCGLCHRWKRGLLCSVRAGG